MTPSRGGARLATRAPFHLEATVRVLQRRPTNLVDTWEDERYRRVLATEEGPALVEVSSGGSVDEPDVRLRLPQGGLPRGARAGITRSLRQILGLDVDPGPLQELAEAERGLRPVAIALRGMRPPRFASLFETVANVVPFQQVSLDAGVAVVRRLVERFGTYVEHGGRRYYAFPQARVIAGARVEAVRACGLSSRKAETICHLARAIEAGELREDALAAMPSADAVRSLEALPGIGPWSAQLILLRGLGRLDVFPPGDVGVLRGLGARLGLRSESALARVAARFGERRGYLYFCSLGGALLDRGLIRPARRQDTQLGDEAERRQRG